MKIRTRALKRFGWTLLIVIAILLYAPLPVSAVGVAPGELNFRMGPGQQCTRTLSIINDEEQAATYTIYMDDEHEDWFTISPNEISLDPGQNGEVEVTVSPPLTTLGEHTAFIYITSAEPASGLQVTLGIKLKVNTTVDILSYDSTTLAVILVIIAAIVVIALSILVVIRARRKDY